MQSVPAGVDVERLTQDLEAIPMVVKVHDLHVWTVGSRQMATAHVLCPYEAEFMKVGGGWPTFLPLFFIRIGPIKNKRKQVATEIKKTFHGYDVHFVTVQPEFLSSTAMRPIGSSVPRAETLLFDFTQLLTASLLLWGIRSRCAFSSA
jgi:hypothetical protein